MTFIGNSPFAKSCTPWLLLLWLAHFTATLFTSATVLMDIPSSFPMSVFTLVWKCRGEQARKGCSLHVRGENKVNKTLKAAGTSSEKYSVISPIQNEQHLDTSMQWALKIRVRRKSDSNLIRLSSERS